jgi:hypothetical protein
MIDSLFVMPTYPNHSIDPNSRQSSGSFTATFNSTAWNSASLAVVIAYEIEDDIVTLNLPPIQKAAVPAGAAGTITMTSPAALPAEFRPTAASTAYLSVISNVTTSTGAMVISTAGAVTIYSDIEATANFSDVAGTSGSYKQVVKYSLS